MDVEVIITKSSAPPYFIDAEKAQDILVLPPQVLGNVRNLYLTLVLGGNIALGQRSSTVTTILPLLLHRLGPCMRGIVVLKHRSL